MTLDDALRQEELIRARDWPAEKRWRLDLLLSRRREMDKLFEEFAVREGKPGVGGGVTGGKIRAAEKGEHENDG